MKLMIDANVILDGLLEREGFYDDSQNLFIGVAQGEFEGFLTTKSVADIYYIARKKSGDEAKSRAIVSKLLKVFDIVEITYIDCINAFHMEGKDYEDNLIISAAERKGADVILTRNLKDFEKSAIPAQLPGEFLTKQDHAPGKVSKLKQIKRKKH